MQNNRKIPIMCRVDKPTKEWINNHPLSQSDLVNYGLHLLQQIEANTTQLAQINLRIDNIPNPSQLEKPLPF